MFVRKIRTFNVDEIDQRLEKKGMKTKERRKKYEKIEKLRSCMKRNEKKTICK